VPHNSSQKNFPYGLRIVFKNYSTCRTAWERCRLYRGCRIGMLSRSRFVHPARRTRKQELSETGHHTTAPAECLDRSTGSAAETYESEPAKTDAANAQSEHRAGSVCVAAKWQWNWTQSTIRKALLCCGR
jgi:hypothetical protein